MKNKLFYLLILALPTLFFSCKKCYVCEEYEYCHECTITLTDTTFVENDCFSTPFLREGNIEVLKGTYGSSKVSCTKESGKVPGFDVEFCGKKAETEEEIDGWESLGYLCREQ